MNERNKSKQVINVMHHLFIFVVDCTKSLTDHATFVTIVLLKTVGNMGWFADSHQSLKNSE